MELPTGGETNIETSTEMIDLTVIKVGLEKTHAYLTLEKTIILKVTSQRLNDSKKVIEQ